MTEQVAFYLLLGLVLLLFLRKTLLARSIRHYSSSELQEKLRTDTSVILLDVRSNREWSEGHIKGAFHIPLHELQRRTDELEKFKTREIVCYCQTGSRSLSAAARLRRYGYMSANLRGGMGEWDFQRIG
jgi:rhodanese-related sulfurtransferase